MTKRSKSKKTSAKVAPGIEAKAPVAAQSLPINDPWIVFCQALVIAAASIWIYSPVFHGGWLMDDNAYITQNMGLRDPYGLLNIWLLPGSFVEYYPIEESVQWFQWQFWHDNASGYHITNIFLHIVGSLMVWKFFSKFNLRFAWLAGLIFAVHPVQVESVAWVAELKNTLSLPPFLLAMCYWIDYEETGHPRNYALALGWFLVAMLCKITMAPFPIIILIYAWWKRGRISWGDIQASVPFFIISFILGLMTVFVGDWYAPGHVLAITTPTDHFDFWSKAACASITTAFYFFHYLLPLQFSNPHPDWPVPFLPLQMLPAYPQWNVESPTLQQFLAWPIMAGLFCWFWIRRKTWGKTALLGFSFFLLCLLPFLGFHSVSYMRFTWVMDHFLYLPSLGLLGLLIAGLQLIDNRISQSMHRVLIFCAAAVVLIFAIESHNYAKTFKTLETSWTYEIQYNPDAWLAHNNLGYIMVEQNRLDEAKTQFIEALKIKPDYSEAHNNLGVVYSRTGQIEEAILQYQAALKVNPDYGDAANNLEKLQTLKRQHNFPPANK